MSPEPWDELYLRSGFKMRSKHDALYLEVFIKPGRIIIDNPFMVSVL